MGFLVCCWVSLAVHGSLRNFQPHMSLRVIMWLGADPVTKFLDRLDTGWCNSHCARRAFGQIDPTLGASACSATGRTDEHRAPKDHPSLLPRLQLQAQESSAGHPIRPSRIQGLGPSEHSAPERPSGFCRQRRFMSFTETAKKLPSGTASKGRATLAVCRGRVVKRHGYGCRPKTEGTGC